MSLEKKDLIILPITDEMRNMARYMPKKVYSNITVWLWYL